MCSKKVRWRATHAQIAVSVCVCVPDNLCICRSTSNCLVKTTFVVCLVFVVSSFPIYWFCFVLRSSFYRRILLKAAFLGKVCGLRLRTLCQNDEEQQKQRRNSCGKNTTMDWMHDVNSGYGKCVTTMYITCTRANGRFEHKWQRGGIHKRKVPPLKLGYSRYFHNRRSVKGLLFIEYL